MRPTRRELMRVGLSGLTAVGLGGTMPALVSKFAHADKPQAPTAIADDNVLVIVQLSGGNDGLNTVVPVGDDAYRKARPTIGLSDGLHRLHDAHALHPAMTALKELFDAGKLAVINGCGYPQPSRSHSGALEMWHTASDANGQTSGWLGHYLDHVQRGTLGALNAVNVGAELPQALVADREVVPSIQALDDLAAGANVSAARQYLARRANDAVIDADAIRKVTARYRPDASYPGGLGQPLRLIAQLIAAQMGTKLFYCQIGGFDTHASQLAQHERLLGNVSSSIAAFVRDLEAKRLDSKVCVMCFSEFGRRVVENSSAGTDHGAAGPMFVVGSEVRGGMYGEHPSLTQFEDGDLKHTTDFRAIYATLLEKWLNAESARVLHGHYPPVAFL